MQSQHAEYRLHGTIHRYHLKKIDDEGSPQDEGVISTDDFDEILMAIAAHDLGTTIGLRLEVLTMDDRSIDVRVSERMRYENVAALDEDETIEFALIAPGIPLSQDQW